MVICCTRIRAGPRVSSFRKVFDDRSVETEILDRLDKALTASGFWDDFETDWVALDAELMPWSEKAKVLLKTQYGPVGRAGRESLAEAVDLIQKANYSLSEVPEADRPAPAERDLDLEELLGRFQEKQDAIDKYVNVYRRYCRDVHDISDIRVAPFHILATEGKVFDDKSHVWHMETVRKYCVSSDPVFMATDYITVNLSSADDKAAAENWWLSLTESGGEGMVVKPMEYTAREGSDILQPAVKCRGREYLRIIYGPEYLLGDHLERLKKRSLSKKRSLALKEFSLGMEALHRFVEGEPLYKVHECVFGVLALESEPVDARL